MVLWEEVIGGMWEVWVRRYCVSCWREYYLFCRDKLIMVRIMGDVMNYDMLGIE